MSRRRGPNEGSLYRRADGRWVGAVNIGWEGGQRKRKVVYGRTQAEARSKLRAVQTAVEAGLPLPDERRTVAQFVSYWLRDVLPKTVSPGSEETYNRLLRLYVLPAVGQVPLSKLKPADVTRMLRTMEAMGLSPATQNAARKVLGRVLRRAMQEELINRNVVSIVDGPKLNREERRALTPEQARVLLRAIAPDRLGAAYTLALALGLRRGEVLGLRWADVDLDAGTLTVRQQLQRRAAKGLLLVPLKTVKSRRTLVLPATVIDIIRSHRASQAAERLVAGAEWANEDDLVFTTPMGTPVDPDNFRHRLAKLSEKAGLGAWTTHELRHSAGSLLFAMGVPMRVISELYGHSSERVTSEVYIHVQQEHRTEAANAISQVLWG